MSQTPWGSEPLRVQFPALSEFSFTYRSAEEAVRTTEQSVRQSRARADGARISGLAIEEIVWHEREVLFRLAGHIRLRVYLRDEFTEWQVQDDTEPLTQGFPLDNPKIELCSRGTDGEYAFCWDAGTLLLNRVGARVGKVALWAGHVWLHVYFEGHLSMTFCAKQRLNDRGLFLYWMQDE